MRFALNLRRDLDVYVMPRRLTEQQIQSIADFLGPSPTFSVVIKSDPRDEEANRYAGQFQIALSRAKWPVERNADVQAPPLLLNADLHISELGKNNKPRDLDPANILRQALQKGDVSVSGGGAVMAGDYRLFLLVGRRPLEVRQPLSKFKELRRKIIGRLLGPLWRLNFAL